MKRMADYDNIRMKFKNRLREQLGEDMASFQERTDPGAKSADEIKKITSEEYRFFKEEMLGGLPNIYEKLCNFSEKTLKIKPAQEKRKLLEKYIYQAHLNMTPDGAWSASFVLPLATMMFLLLFSQMLFMIFKGDISMFFIFFSIVLAATMIMPLQNMPEFLAQNWRLKASNQMVLCIFYIVTYMRHTSNLEHAIDFAAEHLNPPLSIDFKKVLWDVEMQKYDNIKVSLDVYLENWKEYNFEFVEAMHLIQSSLYESTEQRRIALLDKSLDVILEETYEKMLHYAQNLKSPITMLHMMGVIMPILGMVLLPLVVTFMDNVGWYHLAALYNIFLPIMVYYMGLKILATRPTGYGDSDISNLMKEQDKKGKQHLMNIAGKTINITPYKVPVMMFLVMALIAFFPLLIHMVLGADWDLALDVQGEFHMERVEMSKIAFLEYREPIGDGVTEADISGPYGLGATLFSLALPLGFAFSLAFYYRSRTEKLMGLRDKTKKLELEFGSALFQLGNRIGDGIPAEIAFGKVAQVMQGTDSGTFFEYVTNNMSRMGLGLHEAIFNEKVGALVYYPSTMIKSSMKVLIQSAKKGPQVASLALLNVARYIKEIHRVDERLKDLMSEVVSSKSSQINFLSPAIAGIVIGITSMISAIIGKLIRAMSCIQAGQGGSGATGLLSLMNDGVAPYYFQWVVGFYVVQITIILTILMSGIQNGNDELAKQDLLARSLRGATLKYFLIALAVVALFNLIAANIVGGTLASC